MSCTRLAAATLFAACALLQACGRSPSGPAPGTSADEEEALPADQFSAQRALGELEQIVSYGPRPAGSEAAEAARRHLRAALEEARIRVARVETEVEVEGVGNIALQHLVATLPGASRDRIVLVAPYDSGDPERASASDGASGAAVLLELARVFAHRDFPYTLEFVWLEGEGRLGRGGEQTRDLRWLGSHSLAADWAEAGRLDDIRLLVAVNRVCDVDLDVARDLRSHRHHREALFHAARLLGRGAAFPSDRPFASVVASHLAFRRAGLRTVVALEDASPDPPAGEEPERCAAASLETVGLVLVEGLDRIGARLAKIDRFARVPAAEPEATAEASDEPPGADGSEGAPLEPGGGAESAESP